MAYLILGILSVIVFSPLVIPWGTKLLTYSIITWFLLWIILFIKMGFEKDPAYDAGIISDGGVLGLSIIVVIAMRSLIQFIRYKININPNNT